MQPSVPLWLINLLASVPPGLLVRGVALRCVSLIAVAMVGRVMTLVVHWYACARRALLAMSAKRLSIDGRLSLGNFYAGCVFWTLFFICTYKT